MTRIPKPSGGGGHKARAGFKHNKAVHGRAKTGAAAASQPGSHKGQHNSRRH